MNKKAADEVWWSQTSSVPGTPECTVGERTSGRVVSIHQTNGWRVVVWTERGPEGRRTVRELELRPWRDSDGIEEREWLEAEAERRWAEWDVVMPSPAELLRMHQNGVTHQEIADSVTRRIGTPVSRQAVTTAIHRAKQNPAAEPAPITAVDLRDLNLGGLVTEQGRAILASEPRPDPTPAERVPRTSAVVTAEDWRLRPLLEAAEAYVRLVAAGDRSPAKTWADEQGISVKTVHDRIARARKAGLLTPLPAPGEAGGVLTPKARDLRQRFANVPRA